jgi:hypothetical protein
MELKTTANRQMRPAQGAPGDGDCFAGGFCGVMGYWVGGIAVVIPGGLRAAGDRGWR